MAITYENVNPPIIANTTMQKMFIDGVANSYHITPNEGYVLRDTAYDFPDPEDPESGVEIPGYRTTTAVCGANYNFVTNPRKFEAVLASTVPGDQIFNSGNHEII